MRGVTMVPSSRLDILWLDRNRAMNYSDWNNLYHAWPSNPNNDPAITGVSQNLGGTFTSPPVGLALGPTRLHVFGLGLDYAVYHKVYDAVGTDGVHWSPDWENLGGDMTSSPVPISTDANTIHLFGLGRDRALVHRHWNGTMWQDWDELGGCFTSPPVVLPGTSGSFDIFARGADFLIYHLSWTPGVTSQWAVLGGGLLAQPVAASAPAAVRVGNHFYVFVVANDGLVWYQSFDGKVWNPWTPIIAPPSPSSSLAPSPSPMFLAEPVAIAVTGASDLSSLATGGAVVATPGGSTPTAQPSGTPTGPFRLDVFAVGTNNALWQNSLTSNGWDTWVSLGSQLVCAPSIVAPKGHALSVLTLPPTHFSIVAPNLDGTLHTLGFNGTTWDEWSSGPRYTMPSSFTFSIDGVQINATRALHSDSDLATFTIGVGTWRPNTVSQDMGEVGTGGHQVNLLHLGPLAVELCEPVTISYVIVNSGHNKGLVRDTIEKVVESYIGDGIKLIPVPIASRVLATLTGGLLAADCDGPVAGETITFRTGRDLQVKVAQANGVLVVDRPNRGTTKQDGCNDPDYVVSWAVRRS